MQGEVTEDGKIKGPLIVLDAAHNHESAAALANALKQLFHVEKCIFVVGVNSDKNITAIWRELEPLNKFAVATKSQNARALDPSAIQDVISMFEPEHPDVSITETVPKALEKALSIASETDVICVMGSLYVVAEAREYLMSKAPTKA
jgi:dihydrofolate synthase / folylpolyglutamate synthase